MSSRREYNIEFEQALHRIATPSVFDQIISEIDPVEVPTEYIDRIVVYYRNGAVVELSGSEISAPVPVCKSGTWDAVESGYKQLKEVKVFIDTEKLENDVNWMVKLLMDGRC